jgi:hypothetical protein
MLSSKGDCKFKDWEAGVSSVGLKSRREANRKKGIIVAVSLGPPFSLPPSTELWNM